MKRIVFLVSKSVIYDEQSLKYSISVFEKVKSGRNLQEGNGSRKNSREESSRVEENSLWEKYKPILKPKMEGFHFLDNLAKRESSEVVLFDQIEEISQGKVKWEGVEETFLLESFDKMASTSQQIQHVLRERNIDKIELKQVPFKEWKNENKDSNASTGAKKVFEVFSDPELAQLLQIPPINPVESGFVDKVKKPVNFELKHWHSEYTFEHPLNLPPSEIIKGKQLGRTIGIPTANLSFDTSQLLANSLIPGVYYGFCSFCSPLKHSFLSNIDYPLQMVVSIGSNVQYSQNSLNYEVLILSSEIPNKEFYGESLKLRILGLIRPEAYFPQFSLFIRAMENDVFVAKEKLQGLPQTM